MARRLAALILAALLAAPAPGLACTLWGAVGSRVEGGGALAAKNRDWTPDSPGRLELVRPAQGRAYVALTAQGSKGWSPRAGVNQDGLVVLSASASCLPRALRSVGRGRNRRLLANFGSVEQVLAQGELFAGARPAFYLLADPRRLAVVEVAPGGRWRARQVADGVLCHTNHYLDPEFDEQNRKPALSSRARLERIAALLAGHAAPLTLADFLTFSRDQSAGPDHSLWRTGSTPNKTRTLASFLARLPLRGPLVVEAVLANPGQAQKSLRLVLDQAFWQKRPAGPLKDD